MDTTGKKTIVVFSGDFDKAMAAFIIANGAAAMGDEVTIFFTFWGLNILRKTEKPVKPAARSFLQGMFGKMMPKGQEARPLQDELRRHGRAPDEEGHEVGRTPCRWRSSSPAPGSRA